MNVYALSLFFREQLIRTKISFPTKFIRRRLKHCTILVYECFIIYGCYIITSIIIKILTLKSFTKQLFFQLFHIQECCKYFKYPQEKPICETNMGTVSENKIYRHKIRQHCLGLGRNAGLTALWQ